MMLSKGQQILNFEIFMLRMLELDFVVKLHYLNYINDAGPNSYMYLYLVTTTFFHERKNENGTVK